MTNCIRLLCLASLVAVPAAAADTTFGLQAHLAVPTGTFGNAAHLDGRIGYGLGFHAPIDFGAGHVLRPRLDYLSWTRDGNGIRYKIDSLVVMADYNYFFTEDRGDGAFLIAGLGLHSTRRDTARTYQGTVRKSDTGASGLAYNLGVGYAFSRNVTLDVKYLGMDMKRQDYGAGGSDSGFMGQSVVATVGVTF